MADPVYNSRPLAIMAVTKEPVHVPEAIVIFRTTLDKLANSGDNIIDAATLTAQNARVDKLVDKQDGMLGGAPNKVDIRNEAFGLCFADYRDNLLSVQLKSNGLDFNLAAALIKNNGYDIKKEPVTPESPNIKIKKKKDAENTIIVNVKAPETSKVFAIQMEYTYDDGLTWLSTYPTAVCKREITNLATQKKVKVRARFIIGNDAPLDWMVSNTLNL